LFIKQEKNLQHLNVCIGSVDLMERGACSSLTGVGRELIAWEENALNTWLFLSVLKEAVFMSYE